MLKIYNALNGLIEKGKWILLAVDTLKYFNTEAKKRGLVDGKTEGLEIES